MCTPMTSQVGFCMAMTTYFSLIYLSIEPAELAHTAKNNSKNIWLHLVCCNRCWCNSFAFASTGMFGVPQRKSSKWVYISHYSAVANSFVDKLLDVKKCASTLPLIRCVHFYSPLDVGCVLAQPFVYLCACISALLLMCFIPKLLFAYWYVCVCIIHKHLLIQVLRKRRYHSKELRTAEKIETMSREFMRRQKRKWHTTSE